MSYGMKFNFESFITLVRAEPTVAEFQAALDRQDMLARLTLSGDEPAAIPSDDGLPQREWRGRLAGQDLAFRLGTVAISRLPGPAKDLPEVRAWPLAIWSTNSGDRPGPVAAGALAGFAWGMATGGEIYHWERGVMRDTSARKAFIDFMIAAISRDLSEAYEVRYPQAPKIRGPQPGETTEIEVRVLR